MFIFKVVLCIFRTVTLWFLYLLCFNINMSEAVRMEISHQAIISCIYILMFVKLDPLDHSKTFRKMKPCCIKTWICSESWREARGTAAQFFCLHHFVFYRHLIEDECSSVCCVLSRCKCSESNGWRREMTLPHWMSWSLVIIQMSGTDRGNVLLMIIATPCKHDN